MYERLPSDIASRQVLLMDPLVGTGRTACRAVEVSQQLMITACWLCYILLRHTASLAGTEHSRALLRKTLSAVSWCAL